MQRITKNLTRDKIDSISKFIYYEMVNFVLQHLDASLDVSPNMESKFIWLSLGSTSYIQIKYLQEKKGSDLNKKQKYFITCYWMRYQLAFLIVFSYSKA